MAKEGNYFRVLETHKRRLGDYEQMHFRKSVVVPQPEKQISLAPRRSSRPQLVSFDKNTAAMYLRQTENIWLAPTMSRQDSANVLFNKPIGSFVVRNSQRARYALSLRIPTQSEDDPAVKHFLIQTNQQNFLTIQGSNLPFLSIFDLLAYFCFNQSGGMPCCLRAPISLETGDSESSDSDEEGEEEVCLLSEADSFRDSCRLEEPPLPTFVPPPRHRPRANASVASTAKQGANLVQKARGPVVDNYPTHEVIYIDRERQNSYVKTQKEQKASKQQQQQQQEKQEQQQQQQQEQQKQQQQEQQQQEQQQKPKRTPPPKPPRNFPLEDGYYPVPVPPKARTLTREHRELWQSSEGGGGGGGGRVDKNALQNRHSLAESRGESSDVVCRLPDNDVSHRTAFLEKFQNSMRRGRASSDLQARKDAPSCQLQQVMAGGSSAELKAVVRRVDSIVDMDACKVYNTALRSPPPVKPKPHRAQFSSRPPSLGRDIPPPRLLNRHSRSNEELQSSRPRSNSTKVTSLIQMFESKSPSHSPPQARRFAQPHRRVGLKHPSPDRNEESAAAFAPVPPPKPRTVQPPVPPKPAGGASTNSPVVPPRTPAPLLPPKPPGSKPPIIIPRKNRPVERRLPPLPFEEDEVAPPILPAKRRHHYQFEGRGEGEEPAHPAPGSHYESVEFSPEPAPGRGGRAEELTAEELSTTISQLPGSSSGEPQEGASSKFKWKPSWAKKLPFHRKPRKRIRKFILELAADTTQEFGHRISEFIIDMRASSQEPHQKMLSEIRNFITTMHDYLIQHHRSALQNCGMESCSNFEHVVETTLQQCILQPLSHYVYLRIEEYYSQNGFLFQVQRSVHQGRLKSPEDMGIRKQLVVPGEKVVAELTEVFQRMMKTYCAISKLEYLLEAVRLTYENVKDAKNPKKSMHDIGADDFLPLFVWVLVQCGFHRAEIEAEYMWGLAHPSLFNGEGGYYLTTLTSAVNVLKELTQQPEPTPAAMCQQLPTMNNLQTELKVLFEDENTGQYSSAYYLPIVPGMTVREICEIIAERHQIASPDDYTLFSVINGVACAMADSDRPQERKMQWTLERTTQLSTASSSTATLPPPSSSFIAYKRKHPDTATA